ncbi:MAG: deoxyribodipyrimidine photo-lyase [Verrucomicrobiota bacterium]|nr:DNA photolyase family protein [Limisphaera sp.]MDW8381809.1 deoxyribodipyrimidine photo-lyase [Verrucomicrobiota bacterium]
MTKSIVVWFRLDLRLTDHPALHAACQQGGPVVPVFVWAPEEEGPWQPGGASRWWLHHSLVALDAALQARGSRLIVRVGPTAPALLAISREVNAGAVFVNRRWEPAMRSIEEHAHAALTAVGIPLRRFNDATLFDPGSVRTRSGHPYQVFTAFWKACLQRPEPPAPLPEPGRIKGPATWPSSVAIHALGLLPKPDWAAGLRAAWQPGEAHAQRRLRQFVVESLKAYPERRDFPGVSGTSRLSPHLHFGEISPRQVWHAVTAHLGKVRNAKESRAAWTFLRELGWREFAHHLLFHFPHTVEQPLRPEWKHFAWRQDRTSLGAWQKGLTGYPIVDAGMRELWATGWMHNRVRMIVASFLVKDLRLHWLEGARWFWDTLVDADLANNTLGWQWSAGCGADAAPYFRIFHPVRQGEAFDPRGEYVRRWCPELARLPDQWIHRPFEAPPLVLQAAGVRLGLDYPEPVVSHASARQAALVAWDSMGRISKSA